MVDEHRSGSISERWSTAIFSAFGEPLACLAQYTVIVGVVLVFIFSGFSWRWAVYAIPLLLFGLATLRFWYRKFFDPTYVGYERAIEITWSEDMIHFRGAYFDIWANVNDIVAYKVRGFKRWDATHMLIVKVKGPEGIVQNVHVGGTMPDKWRLVGFLEWCLMSRDDRPNEGV